jgi:hypothetical protein
MIDRWPETKGTGRVIATFQSRAFGLQHEKAALALVGQHALRSFRHSGSEGCELEVLHAMEVAGGGNSGSPNKTTC